MEMVAIIEKKKNGEELSKEEINWWISKYCEEKIPDYQVSALLMAICFSGMTERETFDLTEAMMRSGEILDLSAISGKKCDKHSTGGVGDKTSLALCPMIAALGIKVAKMSGRGLGFTGGTLDKLESIPGVTIELDGDRFVEIVNKIGVSIIGQSGSIVPADKKLYALRDVTCTVDCKPLIASSIMSKKLASGCDCILLDVKYGSGAFMKTKEDAESLAKLMVKIGSYFNRDVRAEITSMNQPLGLAIGNILEVKEAVRTLKGEGPEDFTSLCLSSGATMLLQAGLYQSAGAAKRALMKTIENGKALGVFKNFIKAQGGDITYIDNLDKFPVARYITPVRSMKSGYISSINTMELGLISMRLGAGRETKEDVIDPSAGIELKKKLGDRVSKGDILLTLHTERPKTQGEVNAALNCFEFSANPIEIPPVVEELIELDPETKEFVIKKE